MNDIRVMEEQVAVLQKRIEEAKKEAGAAAREAAKAINKAKTFEWKVEWRTEFLFRVDRRLSQETMDKIAEWQVQFPGESYPHWGFSGGSENRWEGMSFYLIEGYLLSTGGGTVIFISKRDEKPGEWNSSFDQDPMKLTIDERSDLAACVVPKSLIRPIVQ